MQIDQFIATHQSSWRRLEALTNIVRRAPEKSSASERAEFVHLYQVTSAHLSQLRGGASDPGLDSRLTRILAQASSVIYGQSEPWFKAISRFFTETLPAAIWHTRRFHLAAAMLFLGPAVAIGIWFGTSDAARAGIPPAVAEAYINEDFESYYASEAATEFATTVFINNIWVSFLAFALGIAFCVGSAVVLVNNGIVLGQAAGLFASVGELGRFFGLILPHGMLELTAIIIAGGAGLVLGWAAIAPGDRTRADALADEGRRAVVIVMGLVLVFLVAALIEGFVTGSPLSTALRVGIGLTTWLVFILYVVTWGRRAAQLGKTGLWGESRPSWLDEPRVDLSHRSTVVLHPGPGESLSD